MPMPWKIAWYCAVATLAFPALSARAATQVVNTLAVDDWFAGNEGPGGSVGTAAFVPGPAPTPLGNGSVELTVDSTGRASFGTTQYKGTPLAAITQLSYATFVTSTGNPQPPTLQLDMDYNGADSNTSWQGRLVSIPPAVAPGSWVTLNPLAGTWYATGLPGSSVCPASSPCTWAQVLAAFPNAAIRNDPAAGGVLLFRLGGPIAGGAQVHVDAFTIQVGTTTTTYDFEAGAAVNPTAAQGGTMVTIRAYGFRPQSTVRSYYLGGGATGRRRVLLCAATSSETGAFVCSVPLPSGTLAGSAGVHDIVVYGPRVVRYRTQIVLTP